ncbi:FAD-dependent oxidoreductase [Paraburkholderia xenovorans]|uniref:FAD-dependent oxidoreductase n=1 Tax=Paraburkholderia xenovorans TaxID=36873 RepID=UPI0018F7A434|nr:FAD-dependent oxidoreductase [Paraburkholderia xenovorans]
MVVVGGGAAGAAAAVGAARTGAHTLLVERYGFLGGAATHSQVLAYCGFYGQGEIAVQQVAGVGEDVLRELRVLGVDTKPLYSRTGNWIVVLDVEATKLAFDRLLLADQVALRLHTRLVGVQRSGDTITAIIVADHDGMHEIQAACFVDASGEGSLSAYAGVDLRHPAHDVSLQPASLPMRIAGIANGALLDRTRLTQLIKQYNQSADEPVAREDGGVILSLPLSGDVWWMNVDLGTGGLGGEDLARAETQARELAWRYLSILRGHPGFESAYIVSTGPQLGIRETRHPQSVRDVNVVDARQGSRSSDGIGRGCWPMEVHESPGRIRYTPIGGAGFFDIPHQALLPKGVANLRLAGRVIGSDREAYGSIRVMGTSFATGHAAGVSAALSVDNRAIVSSDALRKALVEQHAIV